ncbi:MAG: carboxymuconolactone decarboxylase family protein [Planctomycetota bacterium]
MAWIRTITEDEAEGPLAILYDKAADSRSGGVDNILKAQSVHIEGLRAHLALYRSVMRGTESLPVADRELIAVVVSAINGCRY